MRVYEIYNLLRYSQEFIIGYKTIDEPIIAFRGKRQDLKYDDYRLYKHIDSIGIYNDTLIVYVGRK